LVQRAVWFSELCMPLGWKFAEAVITGQFGHSDPFLGAYNFVSQHSKSFDLKLHYVSGF
jgi:hypothetical protein